MAATDAGSGCHGSTSRNRVWGSAIGAALPSETLYKAEEDLAAGEPGGGPTEDAKMAGHGTRTPLDWRSPNRKPVSCREGLFSNRKRWEEGLAEKGPSGAFPSEGAVGAGAETYTRSFVFEANRGRSRPLESLFCGPESAAAPGTFFRGDPMHARAPSNRSARNSMDRLRSAFRPGGDPPGPTTQTAGPFEFERERRFREPFVAKAYSRDFVWPVRSLPHDARGRKKQGDDKDNNDDDDDDDRRKSDGVADVLGHSYSIHGRRDWRQAKVAARHLKFCPGEQCGVWLPLHCFGTNCNMEDGLDIYCIDCNVRRREEMNQKRKRAYARASRAEDGPSQSHAHENTHTEKAVQANKGWRHQLVLDKYELFRDAHEKAHPAPALDPQEEAERARMREIKKRVLEAHAAAQKRFRVAVQVDPTEVSRRLFMRKKFVCTVTGEKLTPECFLDHHSITFELRDAEDENKQVRQVMDIICSDCVTPDMQ